MAFRISYGLVILGLLGVITFTEGYLEGRDDGYFSAMFDVVLGGKNAEEYLLQRDYGNRKIPRRNIKN